MRNACFFYARRFCLALNDAKTNAFLYIFIWWFRRGIQKSIGFALRGATRRFVLERFVPEMTLCVTFGAPRLGIHFRMLLRCEKYAMICMVWRTLVPQTTLCVAFGARQTLHTVSFRAQRAPDRTSASSAAKQNQ